MILVYFLRCIGIGGGTRRNRLQSVETCSGGVILPLLLLFFRPTSGCVAVGGYSATVQVRVFSALRTSLPSAVS